MSQVVHKDTRKPTRAVTADHAESGRSTYRRRTDLARQSSGNLVVVRITAMLNVTPSDRAIRLISEFASAVADNAEGGKGQPAAAIALYDYVGQLEAAALQLASVHIQDHGQVGEAARHALKLLGKNS